MLRCVGLLLGLTLGVAQAQETVWMKNSRWLQDQINACSKGDIGVCESFVGRALNLLFGISDFCTEDKCMASNDIAAAVAKDQKWRFLGRADNQAVLSKAQQMAQGGLPVVALQTNQYGGMIAILMPGKPQKSPKWKMDVPISVTTRADRPRNSVYAKSINFVFADPAKVRLYSQK